MTKTAMVMILVGAIASGCLFVGLLAGTGPAAEDAPMALALDALPLTDLITTPLPEPDEGAAFKPLTTLLCAVLFRIFPAESWWWQAVLLLVHLATLALAVRVLRRIVGTAAAAAGGLVYALHPLHAGYFAAPLGGLAALVPALLVLACMDRLAAYRERGRTFQFVTCLAAMGLACLSSGHVGIPLILLVFDLSLARGEYAQRLRHKAALQVSLFALFGLILFVRHLASGAVPSLALCGTESAVLLLAAPFGPAPACAWCQWSAWGFLVLCLIALLGRAVIDRRGFPAAFCKVFVLLLVAVALQAEWTDSGFRLAVALPLPLLFFAGLAGLIFAGPPSAEQKRTRSAVTIGLALLASIAMGVISYSLCTSIAAADRQAASAADEVGDILENHHTQLFLYNEPKKISLGPTPLATFLGNDLVVRLRPVLKEMEIVPFPFNGGQDISGALRIFLALRGGAIPLEVGDDGKVSRIMLSHQNTHETLKTVRESGFDRPGEKTRLLLEKNGFPFSLVPPPETVGVRVVLLTPLGVCVADEFETWMRFDSGRETFYFNEEWLRRRLRLFDGGRLVAWVELLDSSKKLIHRTPSVLFHLRLGEN